jgi:sulfur-oxidizing protein SoxY
MKSTYKRRRVVQGIFALAALALAPLQLFARNTPAFKATAADKAMQALFEGKPVEESDQVMLKVPDIAENGAVVPVTVKTKLGSVKSISLIVVENPTPLSASFKLMPGVEAEVSTRIKMGQSSDVIAAVETDSGVYTTTKNVKVTIGGCGG